MGVKFKDIVTPQKINLKDLEGKIIAIDAANTLYQFLSGIRQRDGTPLTDSRGNITSHLTGLLYRTSSIVEKGIKPIYVFDGKPPEFKDTTVKERRAVRAEAEQKWKEALEEGDEEKARKFASRSSRMSPYIIDSAKKLMDFMGIPYIQSFSEGEAQATYLVRNNEAWAVSSQDYDCLLFGSEKIVRNLTISGKLSELEYLDLKKTLSQLGLKREQLVDVALLVGTDFNKGVKGIGAKRAIKIIKSNTLEKYMKEKDIEFEHDLDELRNLFLNPEINHDYNIKWNSVDIEGLENFMCNEHDFSKDRLQGAIKKMENLNTKQKSLTDWFGK
ncbi:flap endonuclease-1 [Methanobrevibacter filiformis]|nr:flap endonuclease-1 [Methanobrevibacter filiformis]